LSEEVRKHVVVRLLEDDMPPVSLSVDALLDKIQRAITHTRHDDPSLSHYYLHDVTLRMSDGQLQAVLDFRK
jgi:hypothetical protein